MLEQRSRPAVLLDRDGTLCRKPAPGLVLAAAAALGVARTCPVAGHPSLGGRSTSGLAREVLSRSAR